MKVTRSRPRALEPGGLGLNAKHTGHVTVGKSDPVCVLVPHLQNGCNTS